MTVRGKVGGAAVTVLAPEATAAGAVASTGAAPGAGTGITPGSRSKPAAPKPSRGQAIASAATDQTGAPDWYQKATNPEPIRIANTGGGVVLGALIWVGVRAYLDGGAAGVKKLLRAKFLNKVD